MKYLFLSLCFLFSIESFAHGCSSGHSKKDDSKNEVNTTKQYSSADTKISEEEDDSKKSKSQETSDVDVTSNSY
jgi:hypothetical protein